MAEDKKTEKIVLEREYNVPLRKAFIKVPKYKKSNKAILGLKEFIKKHMKATDLKSVKVSGQINTKIWENGIRNPPHHIKVKATKYETYVNVELAGEEAPKKASEKKTPAKKTASLPAENKETNKPEAPKTEAKVEEKKEAAKQPEEKKETSAKKE